MWGGNGQGLVQKVNGWPELQLPELASRKTLGAKLHQQCCPFLRLACVPTCYRKSSSTHIVARLLRPGGPNGTPVVGVTLSMLGQAFNQGKKLERSLTGVLGLSRGLEAGAAAKEKSLKEADLAHYGNLAFGAAELLEALLGQNAPELQLEANRVKADMERLNLRQAATAVQASKLETLKVQWHACRQSPAAVLLPCACALCSLGQLVALCTPCFAALCCTVHVHAECHGQLGCQEAYGHAC